MSFDVPSFDALSLAPALLRAVAAEGYTTPTPIQLQAIPHVLAGSDLLGCAQTGTGKTAAFALPILHRLMNAAPRNARARGPRVLVLAPTRELAAQIGDSFTAYGRHTGLRHTVIFGGVGQHPQVKALRHGVDIVVATPGRLLDLMNQRHVDLGAIEIFVLDEADRMMDLGFLPDVRRIIAKLPQQRQTLFFSATMPEPIEQLANAILRDPARVRVAPVRATTELIDQSVRFVAKEHKPKALARLLRESPVTRALVFTRTKHGADRVTKQLVKAGISAEAIHGNKSQSARQRALAGFKADDIQVLVATDLAARGIDVDGISHVVNYDLPHEPETYVHRIGRTGRAGATGTAVSFCDREERKHLQAIERLIRRRLPAANDPASEAAAQQPPRHSHARPPKHPHVPGGRPSGSHSGASRPAGRFVAAPHQAAPSTGKRRTGKSRPGKRERALARLGQA
jgi:ATP-dependent RNA helicase RhlE